MNKLEAIKLAVTDALLIQNEVAQRIIGNDCHAQDGDFERTVQIVATAVYCAQLQAAKVGAVNPHFAKMAREWPSYDQSTLPAIPADWTDASWHNDACPSFNTPAMADGSYVTVFIEALRPEDREMNDRRFGAYLVSDDGHGHGIADTPFANTDDWSKLLRQVEIARADRTRLVELQVHLIGYDPFKDDPQITEAEVRQTLLEYIEALIPE
jgi:hypothetical protein